MKQDETLLKLYHSHTLRNYQEIQNSEYCGCIACQKIYPADVVIDFIDDGETALCPECGVDAVIGDGSGLALNKEILKALNTRWF